MFTQGSNEIYERHLKLKKRGFPLRIPDPNQVHSGYRGTGIRRSDVAILWKGEEYGNRDGPASSAAKCDEHEI